MNMDKIHTWINTGLIVVVMILALVGGNQPDPTGGTRFPNGLSADGTSPSAGQVRGTTLLSTGAVTLQGTLAVTGATTLSSTVDVTGTTTVGRLEQGGGITTLTDANGGAFTLTAFQMTSGVMTFAAGGLGQETITITMPATSTMTELIPNAGDSATWIYDSSLLAAATTTTFAAGTGMVLHEPDGGNLVVAGATMATIMCHRKADTDIDCVIIEAQPG